MRGSFSLWFMTREGLFNLLSIRCFCLKEGAFQLPHFISACLLVSLPLFTILLLLYIWSFFFFLGHKVPSSSSYSTTREGSFPLLTLCLKPSLQNGGQIKPYYILYIILHSFYFWFPTVLVISRFQHGKQPRQLQGVLPKLLEQLQESCSRACHAKIATHPSI